MSDREFWNRRDDWERLPRRPIAVGVALAGLALGGMAFALTPGGSGHRVAHRPVHAAQGPYPANVAPSAPVVTVPVSAEIPAAEVSALPVVAPTPAAVVLPARLSESSAASGRGSSTPVEAASAAPAQPPAPPVNEPAAPPPAPEPVRSCVVDVLGVCVQVPSVP